MDEPAEVLAAENDLLAKFRNNKKEREQIPLQKNTHQFYLAGIQTKNGENDSLENTISGALVGRLTNTFINTGGYQTLLAANIDASREVQDIQDLIQKDKSGRTVLHRAAFEQNFKLVTGLCKEAKDKDLGQDFIDKEDLFGNTPLVLSCVLDLPTSSTHRCQTIESLHAAGAGVNARNKKTLWTPLAWCAYYGDKNSVDFLLALGAKTYLPDNTGRYPLDWAGKKGYRDIVEVLVQKLVQIFEDSDRHIDNLTYIKDIYQEEWKFIRTPLLRSTVLYWSCYYKLDLKLIQRLLECLDVVPELPLFNKNNCTAIHACCSRNTPESLQLLLEAAKKLRENKFLMNRAFLGELRGPDLIAPITNVLLLSRQEKEAFKPKFLKKINQMNLWLSNYYFKVRSYTKNDPSKLRFFDSKDIFGNTPLHISAFRGNSECADILLKAGADIEAQNNEGWRCMELTRHESINTLFSEYLAKRKEERLKAENMRKVGIAFLGNIVDFNRRVSVSPEPQAQRLFSTEELPTRSTKKALKKARSLIGDKFNDTQNPKLIPDLVISFKIDSNTQKRKEFLMGRMNFYIQILTTTSFNVYLASGITKGTYMILLKMDEQVLEAECHQLGMKIKLLESYQQEVFDLSRRTEFEPFRSLERQQIALNVIKKFVDLDALKAHKVIVEYFRMHTVSGIKKISQTWIKRPRWYWPEPLCSLIEYTTEGQEHNYTAITTLKHYFGDKISFFFAFSSFLTCYLFYLAVPGIAVHSYFFWRRVNDGQSDESMYNHPLLAVWVIYVMLWNVVTVERWKRKNAEIATRWGVSSQDTTHEHGLSRIRKEFSGYECISHNIGVLTKKYKLPVTFLTFVASLPVLVVLLAAVVATFIGTTYLKNFGKTYMDGNYDTALQVAAGVINGVSIFVLNTIYMLIARWFVDRENHRFQESYERSLILKSFVFRFLNSFIGVFYVAYLQKDANGNYSSLEDIFILLVTLFITKEATSIFTLTLLPYITFRLNRREYFKAARVRAQFQLSMHGAPSIGSLPELSEQKTGLLQRICKKRQKSKKKEVHFHRPVLDCKKGYTEQQEDEWELSEIELDGIRNNFKDLVDSYGEIFVLLSFITLFAAAFAYGPAIALITIIIDIRSRLFALLNVYDRPPASTYNGIGYWLVIWEAITIGSVFTNLVLLYRHLDYNWDNVVVFDQTGEFAKLFIFIIAEHLILILKYFLADIIADAPGWVLKAQEKIEFEEELETKQLRAALKKISKNIEDESDDKKKSKLVQDNTRLKNDLGLARQEIDRLSGDSLNLIRNKERLSNLNHAIKLILYDTYATIERELLINRVADINELSADNLLVRCTICVSKKAVVEFKTSRESVCRKCFFTAQSKLNFADRHVDLIPSQKVSDSETGLQEELDKLRNKNKKTSDEVGNVSSPKIALNSHWRKFEYYSYPINIQSEQYGQLNQVFKTLLQIYITSNGISPSNVVVEEKRFMRIKRNTFVHVDLEPNDPKRKLRSPTSLPNNTVRPSDKSVFKTELDQEAFESCLRFVQLSNFNVEEKLFMNKAAYLVFKRNGAQAKFQEFYRILKSLQDGTFENKLYILFDLLDENDDGFITPEDFIRVIRSSYIQSGNPLEDVRQTALSIFKEACFMDKKGTFTKILESPNLKELLMCLLQVRS